jgi:hypothetical protein
MATLVPPDSTQSFAYLSLVVASVGLVLQQWVLPIKDLGQKHGDAIERCMGRKASYLRDLLISHDRAQGLDDPKLAASPPPDASDKNIYMHYVTESDSIAQLEKRLSFASASATGTQAILVLILLLALVVVVLSWTSATPGMVSRNALVLVLAPSLVIFVQVVLSVWFQSLAKDRRIVGKK